MENTPMIKNPGATGGKQRDDSTEELEQAFHGLNRKFEEQEAQRKARSWRLPYFDLTGFPIEQEALGVVSRNESEQAEAIPFFVEGREIKLGVIDPKGRETLALIASLKKKNYSVELYFVSRSGLADAQEQYKKIIDAPKKREEGLGLIEGEPALKRFKELQQQSKALIALSITEVLQVLFGAAVVMRASDVHLEPEKDGLKIRFRIDGILQDMGHWPSELLHKINSRIKLLSKLKLNVTRRPQDGRFSLKVDSRELDMRVSVLPTTFGESITIRLLGLGEKLLKIQELGMTERMEQDVLGELNKRTGMILTTGPTGSGKTTTLYSFLNHLNLPGSKIITLEDPVEYRLEGVTQTPIDHSVGMDFAKGLRSVVRQDPDIIMVGEIRDGETADTAVQAALTGHLVLSTLHTNNAPGAIPRLLDMGVKETNLAPALNLLMAQRLVRKICSACKEVYKPSREELARVKKALAEIPDKAEIKLPQNLVFYHSRGCAECHNLGYWGRVGVFEVFVVDEEMERLIFGKASSVDVKKAAVARGMLTMQQDGIVKALSGITDLPEVWRVTEE